MIGLLKKAAELAYPNLPVVAQNAICSVYGKMEAGTRYGKVFEEKLAFLSQTEFYTKDQIAAYQFEAINALLTYVKGAVPYYRNNDAYPKALKELSDIQNLPVLTKTAFRESADLILSDRYDRDQLKQFQTSGTTGKPMVFYRDATSIAFQWAVWSRHKHRFGVRYNDYHALFTGKPIVPASQTKPPFWRRNRPMNQLIFGMLHTNPATIGSIMQQLEREPVKFYTGYPSIIYQIAVTARDAGLKLKNGPKVIFTGAEPLYDFQRSVIEVSFGAPVTDQYGTSEGVANASKCEKGNYHEDFEFGYLEVVKDGLSEDPDVGEIVMTGFSNYAMPLIRYAIGDRGKLSDRRCSCGRSSRILEKLEGRSEDYVITPEGNRITRFDYVFKGVEGLEEAQVVQHTPGAIDLRIVKSDAFSDAELAKIQYSIKKYVSNSLVVNPVYVDHIERTSSGKFRAVVNQL